MFKLTTNDIEGQTSEITESLDELARKGARRMIAAALELEAEQYVQALRHLRVGRDSDRKHRTAVAATDGVRRRITLCSRPCRLGRGAIERSCKSKQRGCAPQCADSVRPQAAVARYLRPDPFYFQLPALSRLNPW